MDWLKQQAQGQPLQGPPAPLPNYSWQSTPEEGDTTTPPNALGNALSQVLQPSANINRNQPLAMDDDFTGSTQQPSGIQPNGYGYNPNVYNPPGSTTVNMGDSSQQQSGGESLWDHFTSGDWVDPAINDLQKYFGIQTPDQKIAQSLPTGNPQDMQVAPGSNSITGYDPSKITNPTVANATWGQDVTDFLRAMREGALQGLDAPQIQALEDRQSGLNPNATSSDYETYNPQYISDNTANIAQGLGAMLPILMGNDVGAGVGAATGEGVAKLFPKLAGTGLQNFIGGTVGQAAQMGAVSAYQEGLKAGVGDETWQQAGQNVLKSTGQGAIMGGISSTAGQAVRNAMGRLIGQTSDNGVIAALQKAAVAATGGAVTGTGVTASNALMGIPGAMSQIDQNNQTIDKNNQVIDQNNAIIEHLNALDGGNRPLEPHQQHQTFNLGTYLKNYGPQALQDVLTFGAMDAMMSLAHGKVPGMNSFGPQAETAGTAGEQTPPPSGFRNYVAADQFQNTHASFMTGTRDMAAEGYVDNLGNGIWRKGDQQVYEMVPFDENWLVPKWEQVRMQNKAATGIQEPKDANGNTLLDHVTNWFKQFFTPKTQAPIPHTPQDQTNILRQLTGDVQQPPKFVENVDNGDKPVENSQKNANQTGNAQGMPAPTQAETAFANGQRTGFNRAFKPGETAPEVQLAEENVPKKEQRTVSPEIQKGDQIILKGQSSPVEVIDNSDKSMLTVKNGRGATFQVGRKAVDRKVNAPEAEQKPAESQTEPNQSVEKGSTPEHPVGTEGHLLTNNGDLMPVKVTGQRENGHLDLEVKSPSRSSQSTEHGQFFTDEKEAKAAKKQWEKNNPLHVLFRGGEKGFYVDPKTGDVSPTAVRDMSRGYDVKLSNKKKAKNGETFFTDQADAEAKSREIKGEAPKAEPQAEELPWPVPGRGKYKSWADIQADNPTFDKEPPNTEYKDFRDAPAAFKFAKDHPDWIYRHDDGQIRMYAPDDTPPKDQRFIVGGNGQIVRGEGPEAYMTHDQAKAFAEAHHTPTKSEAPKEEPKDEKPLKLKNGSRIEDGKIHFSFEGKDYSIPLDEFHRAGKGVMGREMLGKLTALDASKSNIIKKDELLNKLHEDYNQHALEGTAKTLHKRFEEEGRTFKSVLDTLEAIKKYNDAGAESYLTRGINQKIELVQRAKQRTGEITANKEFQPKEQNIWMFRPFQIKAKFGNPESPKVAEDTIDLLHTLSVWDALQDGKMEQAVRDKKLRADDALMILSEAKIKAPEVFTELREQHGKEWRENHDKENKEKYGPMSDEQMIDLGVMKSLNQQNLKENIIEKVLDGNRKGAFKQYKEFAMNGGSMDSVFNVSGFSYRNGKPFNGLKVEDRIHGKEHYLTWENAFDRIVKQLLATIEEKADQRLAEHEENSAPAKVGDTRWFLNRPNDTLTQAKVISLTDKVIRTQFVDKKGAGINFTYDDYKNKTFATKEEALASKKQEPEKPETVDHGIDWNDKNIPTKQRDAVNKLLGQDVIDDTLYGPQQVEDWKGIYQDTQKGALYPGAIELRYDSQNAENNNIVVFTNGEVHYSIGDQKPVSKMKTLWKPAEDDISFAGMGLTIKERTLARRAAAAQKALGKKDIDPKAIVDHIRKQMDNHDADNKEAIKELPSVKFPKGSQVSRTVDGKLETGIVREHYTSKLGVVVDGKEQEWPLDGVKPNEETPAKKSVLKLTPDEMTNKEYMSHYSNKELQAALILLGAPHSGTKQTMVDRLATYAEIRQTLSSEDQNSLMEKYTAKQMKDMLKRVKESVSPSDKKSLAGKLIRWRDDARKRGQKALEDVRKSRAVTEEQMDDVIDRNKHQEVERDYLDVGDNTFETGQIVAVKRNNGQYSIERIQAFNHMGDEKKSWLKHDEIGTVYAGSVTGGTVFHPAHDVMPLDQAISEGKTTPYDVLQAVKKAGWEMPEGIVPTDEKNPAGMDSMDRKIAAFSKMDLNFDASDPLAEIVSKLKEAKSADEVKDLLAETGVSGLRRIVGELRLTPEDASKNGMVRAIAKHFTGEYPSSAVEEQTKPTEPKEEAKSSVDLSDWKGQAFADAAANWDMFGSYDDPFKMMDDKLEKSSTREEMVKQLDAINATGLLRYARHLGIEIPDDTSKDALMNAIADHIMAGKEKAKEEASVPKELPKTFVGAKTEVYVRTLENKEKIKQLFDNNPNQNRNVLYDIVKKDYINPAVTDMIVEYAKGARHDFDLNELQSDKLAREIFDRVTQKIRNDENALRTYKAGDDVSYTVLPERGPEKAMVMGFDKERGKYHIRMNKGSHTFYVDEKEISPWGKTPEETPAPPKEEPQATGKTVPKGVAPDRWKQFTEKHGIGGRKNLDLISDNELSTITDLDDPDQMGFDNAKAGRAYVDYAKRVEREREKAGIFNPDDTTPYSYKEEAPNGVLQSDNSATVEGRSPGDVSRNGEKGNAGGSAGSGSGIRGGTDVAGAGATSGAEPTNRRNEHPDKDSALQRDSETGVGDRAAGSVRPDKGQRSDSRADTGAVHGSDEREQSDQANEQPTRKGTERGESVTKSDFQITNELDDLGGAKTKYKNNVEAIRTLIAVERAQRLATPEEQAILAKYVGWGGLAPVFEYREDRNREWMKERQELSQMMYDGLITKDEYEEMRSSTLNAHYTSPQIINAMYEGLARLGFEGGRILEPSMGTGNFFGLMPKEMTALSKRTGVEKDPITGRIASQLYQKANVRIQPFEEFKIGNGYFDVAIGNVPFGSFGVHDSNYKGKEKFVTKRIHNYFFIKSLDKVRDGGIVMFVTSSGTLNARDASNIRALIAEKADFLGAIRLPGDAFKNNAGTEVTTDIIILQKRPEGQEMNHAGGLSFLNTTKIGMTDKEGEPLYNNQYFEDHPEQVLGEYTLDKLTGKRLGVKSDGRDMAQALKDAFNRLPEGVYREAEKAPVFKDKPKAEAVFMNTEDTNKVDEGGYTLIDGKVHQRVGDSFIPFDESKRGAKQTIDRIKGMIPIRDAARDLIRMQMSGASDSEIKAKQKELNSQYDAFVKKNGYLNDDANTKAFDHDPIGAGLLRSLETGLETKKEGRKKKLISAKKEKIFSERTIQTYRPESHVDSADEALVVSLFEKGRLDFNHMEELTGKSKDQLIQELGGNIFENPNGTWEFKDEYLSGNVRKKLQDAENAAKNDKRYQRNVEALKHVVPTDLLPDQINAKLGSPWIPAQDVEDFIHEFLGIPKGSIKVQYSPAFSNWYVNVLRSNYLYNTKNLDEYGVKKMPAHEIIETLLNQKEPVITDPDPMDSKKRIPNLEATTEARAKGRMIASIFKDWLWNHEPRAKRLAEKYNWEFNSNVDRNFNGELIYGTSENNKIIPGMNAKIKLNPWQKDAVWRIVQGGNTLLAHVVGAGKTMEMQTAGMEMRRLGLVKKPMYIVPDHMLRQFHSEFIDLYPGANIYPISSDMIPSVGVTRTAKMTEEEWHDKRAAKRAARVAALSKIAVGDYDAIIITHEMFKKFPVSSDTLRTYLQEQMEALEEALAEAEKDSIGKKDRSVKDLENAKKTLLKRLEDLTDADDKDIGIPFEELGVDHIFLDEAHEFKNLSFYTKMTRVAGLNARFSQKAEDMNLKLQWLTQTRGGKGITFATGTPISNSIAEMYTMLRYLNMAGLKDMGLQNFDAWAATFAEAVSGIEMDATGRFREKTRFALFVNLPELMSLYRQVADIKTADMIPLKVPENVIKNEHTLHVVESSPELQAYIKTLVRRAEALKGGNVDPSQDNWLKLTGDGRKAALDMRLVDPYADVDDAYSKIAEVAKTVAHIYHHVEGRDIKGNVVHSPTQVIFLDMGTPKAESESESEDGTISYSQNGVKVKAKEVEDGEWEVSFSQKGQPDICLKVDTSSQEDLSNLEEHAISIGTKFWERLQNVIDADASSNFSVYQNIKDRLVRLGIPENEIEFMQNAKTDDDKAEIFEKMRSGELRVLIGSTKKMGAGTNIQKRLIAEHHVDAPWRPADIEQREGRIIRQGNENNTVHIHTYTTKGSFDTLMWDILKTKAKFIAQVMNGSSDARTAEDIEEMTMNFAMVMAATSGKDTMIKKLAADKKYNELAILKTAHEKNRMKWNAEIAALPGSIESMKAQLATVQKDLKNRENTKGDNFKIQIDGETFTTRNDAGDAMKAFVDRWGNTLNSGGKKYIGKFAGFDVALARSNGGDLKFDINNGAYTSNTIENSATGAGMVSMLEWAVGKNIDLTEDELKNKIEHRTKRLAELKELVNSPFKEQKELDEAYAEQQRLTKQLLEESQEKPPAGATEAPQAPASSNEKLASDYDHLASGGGRKKKASASASATATAEPEEEEPLPENPLNRELNEVYLTPPTVRMITAMLVRHMETIIHHTGRMASQGAEGEFSNLRNVGSVKEKNSFNWRVLGHEAGHAFQRMYDHVQGVKDEMENVVRWFHTNPDSVGKAKMRSEGFSEFFRIYTVDPAAAEVVAPKTTEIMNDVVASDPELQDLFSKIGAIVDNELAGSAFEQGIRAQSFMRGTWDDGAIGEQYEMGLLKRFIANVFDFGIPLSDLDKAAAERGYTGQKTETLAMITGGAKAKAIEMYRSVPRTPDGKFIEGVNRPMMNIEQDALNEINKVNNYQKQVETTLEEKKNGKLKVTRRKRGAYEIYSTMRIALSAWERYKANDDLILPLSRQQVDKILKEAEEKYPDALKYAKEAAQTNSALDLNFQLNTGLMTQEQVDATRKKYPYGYYMAFIGDKGKKTRLSGTNQNTYGKTFRRIKSFTEQVVDVFNSQMMKYEQLQQAAERKRVLDELKDIAQKVPDMGAYVRQITIQGVAKKLGWSEDEVIKMVERSGVLPEDVSVEGIGDQVMKYFQPGDLRNVKATENILMTRDNNGKAVFLEVAPDIMASIQAMTPLNVNTLMKIVNWISRGNRYFAVLQPHYWINALGRDIPVQMIQTVNGIDKQLQGMLHSFGTVMGLDKDALSAFIQSGGYGGSVGSVLRNMTKPQMGDGFLYTSRPGVQKFKRGTFFVAKTPQHVLKWIEEYPRMNEYKVTWKRLVKEKGYDANKMWNIFVKEGTGGLPEMLQKDMRRIIEDSTYASREVIMNFTRRGMSRSVRQYSRAVPFLTGALTGTYRAARTTTSKRSWIRAGIGMLGMIALSTLSWWTMNQSEDNKDYFRDISSEARDKYWFFPSPIPGRFFKLDKSFFYAFPANIWERYLDFHFGPKNSLGQPEGRTMTEGMLHNFLYEFGLDHGIPNLLQIAFDIASNTNSLGGKITPQSLTGELPANQFDASSSELAKGISAWLQSMMGSQSMQNTPIINHLTPKNIDYFISQMFGQVGKGVQTASNMFAGDSKPDLSIAGAEYGKPLPQLDDKLEVSLMGHTLSFGRLIDDFAGSFTSGFLTGRTQNGSRIEDKFYSDVNNFTQLSKTIADNIKNGVTTPPKGATMNDARGIAFLPTLQAYQKALSDTRNIFNAQIAQAPDAETRRVYTLQMNYFTKLIAGLPYNVQPEPPSPDANLSPQEISNVENYYMQQAQKKQADAIKLEKDKFSKGDMNSIGPIFYSQFLMAQLQGQNPQIPQNLGPPGKPTKSTQLKMKHGK